LPSHLVVVDAGAFGDDDGEEVDGAFELPDRRLKAREYVPGNDSRKARVDEPLVLLHMSDPTSFGVQRKDAAGQCPTASNRACYPCVRCLAWHRARGAPAPRWGWGLSIKGIFHCYLLSNMATRARWPAVILAQFATRCIWSATV